MNKVLTNVYRVFCKSARFIATFSIGARYTGRSRITQIQLWEIRGRDKRKTDGLESFSRFSLAKRRPFPFVSFSFSLIISHTRDGSARCFGIVRQIVQPRNLFHPGNGKPLSISKYRIACVPSRSDFLAIYLPPTQDEHT